MIPLNDLIPRSERIDKLDAMVWSFSRAKCFENCPTEFYLKYLEAIPGRGNAFAQAGSLMHSILERYFTGDLSLFELSSVYDRSFDGAVTEEFPPYMPSARQAIYEDGYAYLNTLEPLPDGVQILGVEHKVRGKIGPYPFVGFIDLVLRADGKLVICDHKSKKSFKSRAEKDRMFDQLYLYSALLESPVDELWLNTFRSGIIHRESMLSSRRQAVCDHYVKTIDSIFNEDDFFPNQSISGGVVRPNMYCDYMCSMRDACFFKRD